MNLPGFSQDTGRFASVFVFFFCFLLFFYYPIRTLLSIDYYNKDKLSERLYFLFCLLFSISCTFCYCLFFVVVLGSSSPVSQLSASSDLNEK